MQYNNYKQRKAIEIKNKQRLLSLNNKLTEDSGIYILTRFDENGIKYAYVGQAKHILTRLAEHLVGYQHIDLSLKKHGLFDKIKNEYGWQVEFYKCEIEKLDEEERKSIKLYIDLGYQMRNKTLGGQDKGKIGFNDNKPSKGYYAGIEQGINKTKQYIKTMFEKYLGFDKKKQTKICERKLEEFKEFLKK